MYSAYALHGSHHGEGLRRQRAIWLAGGCLWRSRRGWGLLATLRDLETGYQVLKLGRSLSERNMWRDGRVDEERDFKTYTEDTFRNVLTIFCPLWFQTSDWLQPDTCRVPYSSDMLIKWWKQKENRLRLRRIKGFKFVFVPYWLCSVRGQWSWRLHFSSKVWWHQLGPAKYTHKAARL